MSVSVQGCFQHLSFKNGSDQAEQNFTAGKFACVVSCWFHHPIHRENQGTPNNAPILSREVGLGKAEGSPPTRRRR